MGKSACCSCRGQFSSQHPRQVVSQLHVTPAPGEPIPSSALRGVPARTQHTLTQMQVIKIKPNFKKKKLYRAHLLCCPMSPCYLSTVTSQSKRDRKAHRMSKGIFSLTWFQYQKQQLRHIITQTHGEAREMSTSKSSGSSSWNSDSLGTSVTSHGRGWQIFKLLSTFFVCLRVCAEVRGQCGA